MAEIKIVAHSNKVHGFVSVRLSLELQPLLDLGGAIDANAEQQETPRDGEKVHKRYIAQINQVPA